MRSTILSALLFGLLWPHSHEAADGQGDGKVPVFPEGSAIAGQTLFIDKGCYQCHHAGDVELPVGEFSELLIIPLGTSEHAAWSRDDHARAIMNPDHTISEEYRKAMTILGERLKAESSPMPNYADLLTVGDLVHLVTFLESLGKTPAP